MSSKAAQSSEFDVAQLTEPAADVEAFLGEFLEQRPLPGNLREAVRYSLLGPGKRLRPVLVVRACEAVGGDRRMALPAAGAIEMIHAFSLIHDDLPALDDDDLRRGRPTLHKHAGEAMAVLAGDALSALAFELIATRVADPALVAALIRELAVATNDMIAGQIHDTLPDFPEDTPPLKRLETIHRHKTGALLRCACRMGGLCGQAPASQLEALTDYAEATGLMFQVVDDLLDVTQTSEHLGKATGKDADAGKLTYPEVMGVEASRKEVARLHDDAIGALKGLGEPAEPLRVLADYMAVRTR